MVLGDVNGDSNLDLAIDSHDSYGVILILGDGKGGLTLVSEQWAVGSGQRLCRPASAVSLWLTEYIAFLFLREAEPRAQA
jgi:hypothetical protein